MLMNYHAMTMNEARDSPARRRQFLVICTVMAAAFLYSFTMAGGFSPLNYLEGNPTFPGGEWIYKFTERDYAASYGLVTSIGRELGLKRTRLVDKMYVVYLDDPKKITSGRKQRFAGGYLFPPGVKTSEDDAGIKEKLLATNEKKGPITDHDRVDLAAQRLWPLIKYETVQLPTVPALVATFAFTDGFVSALLHSYRVIPAMRAAAKERMIQNGLPENTPVVVVTTCSGKESMCTHYAPLEQTEVFLLGRPTTEVYAMSLPVEPLIDFGILYRIFFRTFPFLKFLIKDKEEEGKTTAVNEEL